MEKNPAAGAPIAVDRPLLDIADLSVEYRTFDGVVSAVNGLNLSIGAGENLGLVGETGAGKTTTALTVLKLLPPRVGFVTGGRVVFEGRDLLRAPEHDMQTVRGNRISMIFQNPMTSLNPVFTVEQQIQGVLMQHQHLSKEEAKERVGAMLELVGISRRRALEYPHQFSGGMRQRVSIAIALSCNPKLLIADEPTTALDVTIQAQVLKLMNDLKSQFNTSTIMITHDLGIVAENCDTVAVMYAGTVVERAPVKDLFEDPRHPYTVGLFGSLPDPDSTKERLDPIPGSPPDPMALPAGCHFAPRCRKKRPECDEARPVLRQTAAGHYVMCHLAREDAGAGTGTGVGADAGVSSAGGDAR